MKRLISLLLAAAAASLAIPASAGAEGFDQYGIASFSADLSTHQAGAHPDFTTSFDLKTDPTSSPDFNGLRKPYAKTNDVVLTLPPGLLGNLNAVQTCTAAQFATAEVSEGCPLSSQVGIADLRIYFNSERVAIYNLEPAGQDEVARLGFYVLSAAGFISIHVRSQSPDDYGLTAESLGLPSIAALNGVTTTLWGVPADPTHDRLRLTRAESSHLKTESPPRSFGRAPAPFLTNPTTCGEPLAVGLKVDSYPEPDVWHEESAPLGQIEGCESLDFDPSFALTPTSREAAAPSGADAELRIPQNEAVNGLATSELHDAVVKLPEGVTVNPEVAHGLEACSADQIGYGRIEPAHCPEAAKIATVEIDSPSLSRPVHGAVYQRTPEPGHLARAWLVADELGIHVKLPAEFQLDGSSGRVTALFLDTPQVPVRAFLLHFKGGPQGALATPKACGTYQSEYSLTPWSGGPPVDGMTPMTLDEHCGSGGFSPKLSAGTVNPAAAAFSPLVTRLSSEFGEQNLASLSVTFPTGVLAKLAGVPVCPAAVAPVGNCPAGSQIGSVAVATGPGPNPLWIPQPGKAPTAVYLGGPYKGDPYSLVVEVPAQAGPFDLGTVLVRARIHVDPDTAQVTVASDPLPQILEGIPISYRTVYVDVDRRDFALNPTGCGRKQVQGIATSAAGSTARLASSFEAANCASLPFAPALSLYLKGGTKRGSFPALKAVLATKNGEGNLGKVSVALSHSEFLAQGHIRTVCTRVQFAADACPAGSVYGRARAISPLLDQPLEGPVYLRSSSNPLPDLVVALRGQIDINLAGRIDNVHGGIRTTFPNLPDAPISRFVLSMKGGKKGLLVNSRNICASAIRATIRMTGQNGKQRRGRPVVGRNCRRRVG